MTDVNQYSNPPGAGAQDVVTQLRGIVQQLTAWVAAFSGRVLTGSFTMGAAASTVVLQPAVKANSIITLTSTNASAGTLVGGAKSPYISAISPGISFTVSTANAAAAAGTETFNYSITTPV
jgi:hypothetical protein